MDNLSPILIEVEKITNQIAINLTIASQNADVLLNKFIAIDKLKINSINPKITEDDVVKNSSIVSNFSKNKELTLNDMGFNNSSISPYIFGEYTNKQISQNNLMGSPGQTTFTTQQSVPGADLATSLASYLGALLDELKKIGGPTLTTVLSKIEPVFEQVKIHLANLAGGISSLSSKIGFEKMEEKIVNVLLQVADGAKNIAPDLYKLIGAVAGGISGNENIKKGLPGFIEENLNMAGQNFKHVLEDMAKSFGLLFGPKGILVDVVGKEVSGLKDSLSSYWKELPKDSPIRGLLGIEGYTYKTKDEEGKEKDVKIPGMGIFDKNGISNISELLDLDLNFDFLKDLPKNIKDKVMNFFAPFLELIPFKNESESLLPSGNKNEKSAFLGEPNSSEKLMSGVASSAFESTAKSSQLPSINNHIVVNLAMHNAENIEAYVKKAVQEMAHAVETKTLSSILGSQRTSVNEPFRGRYS